MNADLERVQEQALRVGDSDPVEKNERWPRKSTRAGTTGWWQWSSGKKMNADLEGVQEQALRVGDSDPVEKNERWPRRSTRPGTTGWWQWSSGNSAKIYILTIETNNISFVSLFNEILVFVGYLMLNPLL